MTYTAANGLTVSQSKEHPLLLSSDDGGPSSMNVILKSGDPELSEFLWTENIYEVNNIEVYVPIFSYEDSDGLNAPLHVVTLNAKLTPGGVASTVTSIVPSIRGDQYNNQPGTKSYAGKTRVDIGVLVPKQGFNRIFNMFWEWMRAQIDILGDLIECSSFYHTGLDPLLEVDKCLIICRGECLACVTARTSVAADVPSPVKRDMREMITSSRLPTFDSLEADLRYMRGGAH